MNRRGGDIVVGGNRKSVLATSLRCCASLRADFVPEDVDFFNDQSLHALDGVLVFEAEVEFLIENVGRYEQ